MENWKEIILDTVSKTKQIRLTDIQKTFKDNDNIYTDIYLTSEEIDGNDLLKYKEPIKMKLQFNLNGIEFLITEKQIKGKDFLTLNYLYFDTVKHISKLKQKGKDFIFDIKDFKTDRVTKYKMIMNVINKPCLMINKVKIQETN